jgi:hypothetical protein
LIYQFKEEGSCTPRIPKKKKRKGAWLAQRPDRPLLKIEVLGPTAEMAVMDLNL